MEPSPKTTPDEWGADNRTYAATSGVPGKRNPYLTPYIVEFGRVTASRRRKKTVLVMFAQGGKTEGLFDVVGARLDQSPVPIIWVGPNKQFLTEQLEPRVMEMLDTAPSLKAKVRRGKKMTQTRKVVNGVPLRLAHGGSSTALKSDPFGFAVTDEADELMANVKNQGDPIALVDMRGNSYADFVHAITSTPSLARVETVVLVDDERGVSLEFWARNEDIQQVPSRIWREFQAGTMHHWAWPCPHCAGYFIPRFKMLLASLKKGASSTEARRMAHITCPHCGGIIEDDAEGKTKAAMNAHGVMVAPGQFVCDDGTIVGPEPEAETWSGWVSGLANPFKIWGDLAAEYVKAKETGSPDEVQTVINAKGGEPYWPGFDGKTQRWETIFERRAPYKVADAENPVGEIPSDVLALVVGVDVQGMSLRYVIRGFGSRARSWLIEAGRLNGPTAEPEIWDDLADLILSPRGGMVPRLVMVDSGFRPDKKDMGDVHRVYDFARRYPQLVIATKGRDRLMTGRPVNLREHEVNVEGKAVPFSIRLATLDTDHFKSLVWSRILTDPGAPQCWYVPMNVSEDYARQVASEVREWKEGKPKWTPLSRENHFFDCEAMCAAAGYLLNVQRIPDGVSRPKTEAKAPPPRADTATATPKEKDPPKKRDGFLGPRGGGGSRRGWLER